MSWASLLSKDKGKTVDFGAPQQHVYATDDAIDETERRLHNLAHETASPLRLPAFEKGLLVLDANAIIKGMDNLLTISDALVTTAQVIAEIRDRTSRELLQRLSETIVVLDPTPDAIHAVVACATKTGDLGALSRTDIRVCALALDCGRAMNALHPAIQPLHPEVNPPSGEIDVVREEVTDDDEDEDDSTAESSSDDDSDGGEWITAANIHEFQMGDPVHRPRGEKERAMQFFDGGVACVTSDYAMQNTLLHLGVPIVGMSGMRIRELRLWLLRCTACFTLVSDTTRQFCPSCGSGDTLRRVNYVVGMDGKKQLFINFKKSISTRGTIYNLPKPKGGKRGTNRTLVLREDQLAQVIKGTSGAKIKEKQANFAGGGDKLEEFGIPIRHKKRDMTEPKTVSSYHKYNMNEKRKLRASRKK
ncbi:unnamed protein product [Phytomonas sp. Hart1]|nr:unnamed protein product [Phytomonas sp. Hart1]|eukprot:CCW69926.1 unnamed protein product [Phytomonas sp. isolate Hart1]